MSKALRSRKYVKVQVEGTSAQQFARVRDYCEEVRRASPGSSARVSELSGHTPMPYFEKMYVCLNACRKGFESGCRPIISLDACHLRGQLKGQLLATVGIDGNDGMYPIAYAVTEEETKGSWCWFLEKLLCDVDQGSEHGWCFISDQQKVSMLIFPLYNSLFIFVAYSYGYGLFTCSFQL